MEGIPEDFNPEETLHGQYKSPYKPTFGERIQRLARKLGIGKRNPVWEPTGGRPPKHEPLRGDPFIDPEPTRFVDLRKTREKMERAQVEGELPTPGVSPQEKQK